MASLKEIAELVHSRLFPGETDEPLIHLEDMIASAKSEYAYQWWLKALNEKNSEGTFEVPSYLLAKTKLPVVNNEMDISSLNIMTGLPGEIWLQGIGGLNCECKYVKSTYNKSKILCDDDSIGENTKTVYALGKKLYFPRGAHASELEIVYASKGDEIDDHLEIDDMIAGVINRTLYELYSNPRPSDKTNNSNPNS